MSRQTLGLSEDLYQYMLDVSLRESELLRELRAETANDPMAMMQISPEQGQFMSLLVKLIGAKKALEIGVFTGYSSLCIADAMAEDSSLIACDVSEKWTNIARTYWQRAGLAHKIDLRLAPALETLEELLAQGQQSSFDFIFIDANKEDYLAYYEASMELIRGGGIIAIDNVLWGGSVADPAKQDAETNAIRQLNQRVYEDERADISLLPVADGLMLVLKH